MQMNGLTVSLLVGAKPLARESAGKIAACTIICMSDFRWAGLRPTILCILVGAHNYGENPFAIEVYVICMPKASDKHVHSGIMILTSQFLEISQFV